jgi:hypothetical protein
LHKISAFIRGDLVRTRTWYGTRSATQRTLQNLGKTARKKLENAIDFQFFFLMFSKSADVFPFAKNLAQNALENIFQKSVDPA